MMLLRFDWLAIMPPISAGGLALMTMGKAGHQQAFGAHDVTPSAAPTMLAASGSAEAELTTIATLVLSLID
jgi:hypothetical protein